jgi:hypothetical protein
MKILDIIGGTPLPILIELYFAESANPERAALRWLKSNTDIQHTSFVIRAFRRPTEPVLVYSPGDPDPAYDRVSHLLMTRDADEPRRQTIFVANKKGKLPHRSDALHQARLTDLYASMLLSEDKQVRRRAEHCWVSERELKRRGWSRRGRRCPDALLLPLRGKGLGVVLDIGGKYTPEHLKSLIAYFGDKQKIEVW